MLLLHEATASFNSLRSPSWVSGCVLGPPVCLLRLNCSVPVSSWVLFLNCEALPEMFSMVLYFEVRAFVPDVCLSDHRM